MNTCSKRIMNSKGKEVDRLSSLPDSILAHILSFLPARDAARTCLLRAFGDLWTTIDSLYFDDTPFREEVVNRWTYSGEHTAQVKFIRFIRSFFLLHKRSEIRVFRLRFSHPLQSDAEFFGYPNNEKEKEKEKLDDEVATWINVALGQGVKVLDLGFGVCDYDVLILSYEIPSLIWTSETLVELSLFNCEIELPESVCMGSLRVLKLEHVLCLSDEMFRKITCGCPLLRDLTIIECYCPDGNEIIINCPNVRSFHFWDCVNHVKLIDLSSLKIASLCFIYDGCHHEFGRFKFERFLEKIQHAEVLKLNKEAFAMLTYIVVKNLPFPCNKWKCVQLEMWLNDEYISGICSLLNYSRHLEELIIEFRDPSLRLPEDIKHELDDTGYSGINNRGSEWLIHNLKKVTMRGLLQSLLTPQIDLIKVILQNAFVLEKFFIYAKGNAEPWMKDAVMYDYDELLNISKELLTFPRASKQAMVFLK